MGRPALHHGAGSRVHCLLHAEPEERRPVLWSELKADATIDDRYRIRVQGEGGEGAQVCGLKEVELHLHVTGFIQSDGVIR